jgi:TonB family protein
VKPEKPDPEALPDPSKTTRKRPEVNLKEIVRNPGKKAPTKDPSDDAAKKQDQRMAGVRRDLALQIRGIAGSIGNRLTPGINIEPGDYGPGGGGPAAMNYASYVKKVYEEAWIPPDDTDSDDAITKVTVTIARDGSVSLSRIIRASGDGRVDASVRRTLDRVKFIAPFPEGARDKERTYTINFNLRAKRATG